MRGRVAADGKHLAVAGQPFRVRGTTYGSFESRADGELFPDPLQIKKDFAEMDETGLNVVRTYALPPDDLLDIAGEMSLRVIAGVHYEDWRYELEPGRAARKRVLDAGRRAIDAAMERCAGREEVMAISVGNEVPSDVVRAHGIRAVQDGLSRLVDEVHRADPDMLVTYCNFPTTEFLEVEGQDFASFNVFLEDETAFRRYLRRLQVVSGDAPLVITELGLASRVHGEEAQSTCLRNQLRIVDECGCAGATVFSWTDEWAVAGEPVEDWGFGLTDEERRPKPALQVVGEWARSSVRDLRGEWPRISAVVCAYNAAPLIEKSLDSLERTDYPNLEVIVCDDGSTDDTAAIARRFPFKVLELPHGGLSAARNAGIAAASGEIVAFLDADAFCHPEWPYHLALSMEEDNVVGTGGPNLPVGGVGLVERAVAESPGGPIHVLTSDDRAEHVPGCNMAFRRQALESIGSFDPIYRAAGDDVDVCWKLLDRGEEIAFSPAAQVRHHRRDTVLGYLRQQRGYGRAERLVASRHRHRFNRLGQARWSGFLYGGPRVLSSLLRPIVYHGYLGTAPYQGVVRRPSEAVRDWGTALLPLTLPAAIAGTLLAPLSPWWLVLPGLMSLLVAAYGAAVAAGVCTSRSEPRPRLLRALVAFLHVAQPVVRVWARLRTRPERAPNQPSEPKREWSGDRTGWVLDLKRELESAGCLVKCGEPLAGWDLEASFGPLVTCRMTTAVVWGWTPLWKTRLRPRVTALVGVAAWPALGLLEPTTGAGFLSALIGGAMLERWLLMERVRAALERTTCKAID